MDAQRDEDDVDGQRARQDGGGGDSGHEGAGEPSEAEQALVDALNKLVETTNLIEPAPGRVSKDELPGFGEQLERIAAAYDALDTKVDAGASILSMYVRCAALAIAAGDVETANRWLTDAERFTDAEAPEDAEAREMLAGGRAQPEQLRALAHGRVLFRLGKERAARKLWKQVGKTAPAALAKVARAELLAPRPLNGDSPSLWTFNGFGLRLAGRRDRWPDGSYVATHCITALFIPIFPLQAYRVADAGEGWVILAREQLSKFARVMRFGLVGAIAAAIGIGLLVDHLNDPARLARKRFDGAIAAATSRPSEAAMNELAEVLAGEERFRAGPRRVQGAGAAMMRLHAAKAPKPFTRADVDFANKFAARYQTLPAEARGGEAREATVEALAGWHGELGTRAETAEARLALLRVGAGLGGQRSGELEGKLGALRIEVADARATDAPLEALEILTEQLQAATAERATKIVARLVESPSMLVEAGPALEKWLAIVPQSDPLRQKAVAKRDAAAAAKASLELEAEEALTPARLAKLEQERPWDQHVQLQLARAQIDAGKLEQAAARLTKLGPPGLLVRDARHLLAQLSSALGQLEQADALLAGLLGGRLDRFIAASAALQQATATASDRIERDLRAGVVPDAVRRRYEAAVTEEARGEVVRTYMWETVSNDAKVKAAREAYEPLSDVVPISIAAGTVKLRRAQALSGPARDAMLGEAERTFLAIRTEAEGRPEFEIGLGEIYARLGKTKESEAAFASVLAKRDPALNLRVAGVYRELGSTDRAREIATAVHDGKPDLAVSQQAASFLGLLESGRNDEASEAWYRKADQGDREVRASLLGLEGSRLHREGKFAECGAKFAAVARMYLEGAAPNYNNAAVAHAHRYNCTGELAAMADATSVLERAYREYAASPIIIGNLYSMLVLTGNLRALGKRIDLRALRAAFTGHVDTVISAMSDGPERRALLAELQADRSIQRAEELRPQWEVLAPNSPSPYGRAFQLAAQRRDPAAAVAAVESARRAKALDTSGAASGRAERASGASDAERLQRLANDVARVDEVLAGRLDARTRAVALLIGATARRELGLYRADRAMLARARADALEAGTLWPVLDTTDLARTSALDEAGVAADSKVWIAARRLRSAASALAHLAAENAPIAAAIRSSQPWGELAGYLRASTLSPDLDDLRLARLLGDAELEARAKAVLDDPIERAAVELGALFDPGDPGRIDDLALLEKR